MQNKYKLYHLLLVTILIITGGIALLWLFNRVILTPYPNEEFYLLLYIYLTLLVFTGIIHQTNSILSSHNIIGFNRFNPKYLALALLLALVIWGFDYLLQHFLFNRDFKAEALEWYNKNQNIRVTFLTSVVLVPVVEEMLFRGFLLKTLNNYTSPFSSALLVSLLFALVHFEPMQMVPIFLASMIYVWLTVISKSIIPAITAHFINNFLTFEYYINLIK